MIAVLLVGGEGTRLRPLTLETPKAMVPVLNRPFLEHVVARLAASGAEHVVLAAGHLPEAVRRLAEEPRPGVRVTCSVEPAPLGTAGAARHAVPHATSPLAVLNGDIFSELDLAAMLRLHQSRGAVATIALTWVEDPSAYGVVEQDGGGRVTRFVEKPPRAEAPSHWINAGAYILEPSALELVPENTHYMFERGLFPRLLELGAPVYGYPTEGYWLDMGSPTSYLRLNRDLLQARARSPLVRAFATGEVRAEGTASVGPGAVVEGPALLAEGCRVEPGARVVGPVAMGPGCIVGGGALVEGSVLWEGVRVGPGASVRHCVLGAGVTVGEGAHLAGLAVAGHVSRVSAPS